MDSVLRGAGLDSGDRGGCGNGGPRHVLHPGGIEKEAGLKIGSGFGLSRDVTQPFDFDGGIAKLMAQKLELDAGLQHGGIGRIEREGGLRFEKRLSGDLRFFVGGD